MLIEPLSDDNVVHESEQREEDDKSSNNLTEESSVITEVDTVLSFVDDTKGHVENTIDDGHLHLNRVGKSQFVLLGDCPSGIFTKWISTSVIDIR